MKSWKSFSLFLTVAIVLSLALTANAVRASMSLRNGPDDHTGSHSDSHTTGGNGNSDSHTGGSNSNFHTGGNSNHNNFNTQGNDNDKSRDYSNHFSGNNNNNHYGGDKSYDHGYNRGYDHGYNNYPNYDAYYPTAAAVPVGYSSGVSCNQNGADYCSQYPVGTVCTQEAFQYSCACYEDGTCSTLTGTNSCSECQQVGVVSVLDNYACQAC